MNISYMQTPQLLNSFWNAVGVPSRDNNVIL